VEQLVDVADHDLARLLAGLRRAHDEPQLWAWRDAKIWHLVRSTDVNTRVHELLGDGYTSKDFRTWHATVLAAEALGAHDPAEGVKAVRAAYRAVADRLGNTPAVARSSYIDPRVVDLFLDEGRTIRDLDEDPEAALLSLLAA
jgi:DNA topoisomerase IB